MRKCGSNAVPKLPNMVTKWPERGPKETHNAESVNQNWVIVEGTGGLLHVEKRSELVYWRGRGGLPCTQKPNPRGSNVFPKHPKAAPKRPDRGEILIRSGENVDEIAALETQKRLPRTTIRVDGAIFYT